MHAGRDPKRWLVAAVLAGTAALAPLAAAAGHLPPRGSNQSHATGEGDDPGAGNCDTDPSCPCKGGKVPGTDPVNAIGKLFYHERTDLVVPGVFPIEMKRRYDSRSRYDSPLGAGWAWTGYDLRLYEYPDDSVVVRESCGYRRRFVPAGGGYQASGVRQEELLANPDGTWTMIYPRGKRAHFDLEGRLEALEDPSGNRLEFTYTATKKNLTGTAPTAIDPGLPMVVAQVYQLTRIDEVLAASGPSGRFVTLAYSATTGRLTEVEASDGRTVSYQHDSHQGATRGNLVQVTGLEGVVASYGYADPADDHNLTSLQEGQGTATWTNVYDAEDRVTQQSRGARVLIFDHSTPLRTVVTRARADYLGNALPAAVESYEYSPSGHLTKKVDALGNELRYTLDSQNFRTREELWWNQGTLAAPSLVLQKATDLGYDLDGNLTSRSVTLDGAPAETVTESWTYDHHWTASYQVVSSAAPTKLFRTEYTFYRDGAGRPVNVQEIKRRRDDGSYQTTLLEYDGNGQLAVVTPHAVSPADGLKIRRTYFTPPEASPGLLEEESLEVGGSPDPHLKRTFTYDSAGFPASVTNARSFTTTYANDDLGRVTSVTNPLGEETLYTYSGTTLGVAPGSWVPGANLAEVEVGRTVADGEGQVRRLRFDVEGRLREIERKDEAGTFATFMTHSYDSDDSRTREVDALGRVTAHAFDPLRRLTSMTDAAASPNVTSFAHDAAGNRVQVTDALGRKTVLVYDELDRLAESQAHGSPSQPLSPALVTAFAYDAGGNVTKVTDPKAQETSYAYSTLSELTGVTQHLGQTVAYAYDPRGRFARLTNARGNALVHLYEPWGGLAEVRHYPTAGDADAGTNLARTVSYGYDESGNLTETGDTDYSASSPTLESTVYDELDRPSEVTVHYVPGGDRTLESAYDRFGNRKGLVFTDGSHILTHSWTYDKLGRLAEADLASPSPLEFAYFANDDLETVTHGNGVTTDYTYFPEGPVESITAASPSEQLLELTYAVDKVLNITGITEQHDAAGTNHAYSYGYDALDRLTSAGYPTALGLPASEAFAYDAAGNREDPTSASAYDYDANNRITASPGKAWVYDGDGTPVSVNAGLGSEEAFSHDSSNRMRGYTSAAFSTTANYLYDPLARRIRKTVNGTSTWFVWDGDQLLAEFDGSGDRDRRYTYAGGFAPVEQVVVTGPTSEDIQQVHVDHLDTPRGLSGGAGDVLWRAAYHAFGSTTPDEDPDGDLSDTRFAIRFPGQFADLESSFHDNFYRSYAPSVSRYLEADPIGQASASPRNHPANAPWPLERRLLNGMATNVYAYAFDSPTNVVDSLGLQGKIIDFPKGRTRPPGTGIPRGPADVYPIPPPRPPYSPIMDPRTILCAAGKVVATAAAGGAAVYSVDCAFDRWFCYYGQNQMSACACLKIFDENGLCCPIPGAGPECDSNPNACKE